MITTGSINHPDNAAGTSLAVNFADVCAGAERIRAHALRTPVLTSSAANVATGASIYFKCENLQRIGAFKFRGACNALARMSEAQRRRGVIAYSSGNHAQAIALAGKLLDCPTTIVMPADAPPMKLANTRSHGATVILYDRYTEDRDEIARTLAQRDGLTVVPPFDHPDVIAGQGTAALELLDETGPLDLLFVCLGGGGLISGCALVAHAMAPRCEVIGVEPEAGNDVQRSIAEGRRVSIEVPRTIADGAQTCQVGALTFPIIQRYVSAVVTVSDAALVRTMRWFGEAMKLIVEPTGCLAAAAVLEKIVPVAGKRVGVIVSGGNIDLSRYTELMGDQAYA